MNPNTWYDDVSYFSEVPRGIPSDHHLSSLYRANAPIQEPLPVPAAALTSGNGLGKWAIVAICASVVVVFLLIVLCLWYFGIGVKVTRKKRTTEDDTSYFRPRRKSTTEQPSSVDSNSGLPEPEIFLSDPETDSGFVLEV